MKTFQNQCAQGDVFFRRVEALPEGAVATRSAGARIVAHSETGHHHAFASDAAVELFQTDDQFVSYLRVVSASALEHHRPFDTHESIMFEPGVYEVRRQREPVPVRPERARNPVPLDTRQRPSRSRSTPPPGMTEELWRIARD